MTKISSGYLIFPFPPLKDKKWLITIESEAQAKTILSKLNSGQLEDPLKQKDLYQRRGLHTDGQTPLYQLI